jgi:PTH1 family peptidyl-tRNA hydrolase
MTDKISIIVGLGNPGESYASTYHNVGEQFLTFFGESDDFQKTHSLFSSRSLFLDGHEEPIRLIKPLTFMNNSGQAVKAALQFYKLSAKDLLVIHDEFDIPFGEFRFAKNRGSAGHHGIDSIIEELKTKDFARIRIGIGFPEKKAEELVLKSLSPKNQKILHGVFVGVREKVMEKI